MVGYMILKPVHRWYWGLLQENTGKAQVSIGKSLTERMSREAPSLPPRAASVQILWFIKARQGKGGHYQKAPQLGSSSSLSTSSIFTIHGLMLQKGLTIIFLDNVIHSGEKFCLEQRECLNFFLVTIFLSCSFWRMTGVIPAYNLTGSCDGFFQELLVPRGNICWVSVMITRVRESW